MTVISNCETGRHGRVDTSIAALLIVLSMSTHFVATPASADAIPDNVLRCDPDYDVVFLPFSPVAETDRFEVRVQAKTQTARLPLNMEAYLDSTAKESKVFSQKVTLIQGKWTFVRFFPDIHGKCGSHEIIIRFTDENGRIKEVRKAFEVRKVTPNLLDGAFVSFGAPKNRSFCTPFADARLFTDQRWKEEMDALSELGFKVIICQNAIQVDDFAKVGGPEKEVLRAYYPSRIYRKSEIVANDPIKAVLEQAERNGQLVFIPNGCVYRSIERRLDVMQEIFERYGRFKSFYGWYEAAEMVLDDNGKRVPAFLKVLEEDRRKNDELCPVKPVLWSVGISAGPISAPCMQMLPKLKLEILMPFDVVGCSTGNMHMFRFNSRTFSALKTVLAATDVHLWGNPEAFDFSDLPGRPLVPRFRNGGFDGSGGFIQQIETLQPYVEKQVTFHVTSIMTKPGSKKPLGGEDAVEMYELYKNYMQSPKPVFKNIALRKPYTKSLKPNFPDNENGRDLDSECLSTDGYLAGGAADDIAKLYGYSTSENSIQVTVDFDLKRNERIDRVRVAASPTYKNAPGGCSPDKIAVYLGTTADSMRLVAVLREYPRGWAETVLPKGTMAQHVRLVLSKNRTKQEGPLKMLVNEIEIDQIIE